MFDFQKLTVYNKAKSLNIKVTELLKTLNPDRVTKDQLQLPTNQHNRKICISEAKARVKHIYLKFN